MNAIKNAKHTVFSTFENMDNSTRLLSINELLASKVKKVKKLNKECEKNIIVDKNATQKNVDNPDTTFFASDEFIKNNIYSAKFRVSINKIIVKNPLEDHSSRHVTNII